MKKQKLVNNEYELIHWEKKTILQHEIRPRLSLEVMVVYQKRVEQFLEPSPEV